MNQKESQWALDATFFTTHQSVIMSKYNPHTKHSPKTNFIIQHINLCIYAYCAKLSPSIIVLKSIYNILKIQNHLFQSVLYNNIFWKIAEYKIIAVTFPAPLPHSYIKYMIIFRYCGLLHHHISSICVS